MTSVPSLLKDVIHNRFVVPSSNNKFKLEEIKASDDCAELKFSEDTDIVCLQFDVSDEVLKDKKNTSFDFIFPYFKTGKEEGYAGLLTKNDYIIVYQNEDAVYVLLIELKTKTDDKSKHQLDSGKLFFDFIINRINLANNAKNKKEIKVNAYKRVLFKKNSDTQKGKLTPKEGNCYRLPYQTYHLNQFF